MANSLISVEKVVVLSKVLRGRLGPRVHQPSSVMCLGLEREQRQPEGWMFL